MHQRRSHTGALKTRAWLSGLKTRRQRTRRPGPIRKIARNRLESLGYNPPVGRRLIVILAAALLYAPVDASAQLTVAAAADLQNVMPAIVQRYEQGTGQKIRVSFGSSGQFFSQIQNGAPFDLFLSADESYVKRL